MKHGNETRGLFQLLLKTLSDSAGYQWNWSRKKKKKKKQVKFKKITSIQNFVIFHGDSYLLELLAIMWQGCQKCNNYFQDILFHWNVISIIKIKHHKMYLFLSTILITFFFALLFLLTSKTESNIYMSIASKCNLKSDINYEQIRPLTSTKFAFQKFLSLSF